MSTLTIEVALAERLQKLAEEEHRSVEALLEAMLEKYLQPLTDEELDARLRTIDGFIHPTPATEPPPLTEEESEELAKRIGASGPLSTQIIEERKQGW
jgi:hypothetical protein